MCSKVISSNAAPGVAYGNAHVASRAKDVTMAERPKSRYLVHLGFDLGAPGLIHRLRGVVAKIENHLLQLSRLTGYDGCLRHLADGQLDPRRQRDLKAASSSRQPALSCLLAFAVNPCAGRKRGSDRRDHAPALRHDGSLSGCGPVGCL